MVEDWEDTESWKMLKELATSAQHRAIAQKNTPPKPVQDVLGMALEKTKAMQGRIDEFTNRMSELLRIERGVELEFTQKELDAALTFDEGSDSSKPTEFLVCHGQTQQELCDTICNLNAMSTSTGLGGMHLVLFRVEGKQLPCVIYCHRNSSCRVDASEATTILLPSNITEMLTITGEDANRNDVQESSGAVRAQGRPMIDFPKQKIVGNNIIFASGSPFRDIDLGNGRIGHCNQGNNMYPFPRDSTAILSGVVNVPMVLTRHSFGRNKIEQLFKQERQSKNVLELSVAVKLVIHFHLLQETRVIGSSIYREDLE